MGEKYQDSLDLFRQIYFNEDGTLKKDDFSESIYENDSYTYSKLGKDNTFFGDGRSNITGRSAFTPRIVQEYVEKTWQNPNAVEEFRYFLTIDTQGKFDHNFKLTNIPSLYRVIDVTDMSQEEIMERVAQMLNMSNEEIMTEFNISYAPIVQLELLVDDIAQKYFEEKGATEIGTSYRLANERTGNNYSY